MLHFTAKREISNNYLYDSQMYMYINLYKSQWWW